jgi:hypothetical protein
MGRIQIIAIIASLFLIVSIYKLVKKGKMSERYSILWFIIGLTLFILSVFRGTLDAFSNYIGVYYAPAVLILIMLFFGVLLSIHFSIVISKLSKCCETIIQEMALLKNKVDELQKLNKNEKSTNKI